MPRMFILSGCNGAGKTTASYTLLPELLDCREFVNSDEFAKAISPFNPAAASITASRYMLKKINYLMDRSIDFSVETTLATRSLEGIIERAKRQGYSIILLYFWLNSPDIAVKRVRDRVAAGGHNIPEDVVRRRYSMGLYYFFNTYLELCDRWILADNTITPFTVIAEGQGQVLYIKDNDKFQLIRNLVKSYDNRQ